MYPFVKGLYIFLKKHGICGWHRQRTLVKTNAMHDVNTNPESKTAYSDRCNVSNKHDRPHVYVKYIYLCLYYFYVIFILYYK